MLVLPLAGSGTELHQELKIDDLIFVVLLKIKVLLSTIKLVFLKSKVSFRFCLQMETFSAGEQAKNG